MSYVVAERVIGSRKFYLTTENVTLEVVWNGGPLLPDYDSTSSWDAIERYYRMRIGRCLEVLGRDLSDESPEHTALNESLRLASLAANRKMRRTSSPRPSPPRLRKATPSLPISPAGSQE